MANSDELITSVGKNSNDTAALVWSVADDLVGAYKPHEYGLVILPMTVIKRFHDCLLPTHQAVLDTYKKVEKLAVKDGFLRKASGYQFYNTSPFTFKTLIADPENIVDNFKAYLNGFSDNVQDILARMDFDSQIKHMEEAGLLYQVISDFCTDKGDFSPEKISAVDMGYVFENLVRRFSESYNEEAGAHFTTLIAVYDNDVHAKINQFCAESRVPSNGTAFNQILQVDPSHLIRMSVGVGFRRARLRYAYLLLRGKNLKTGEITQDVREENLRIFKESLDMVTNLNNWHAFMNLFASAGYLKGSLVASSNAVVFSYVLYLIGKYEYKVSSVELQKIIRKWIFMSTITGFYTGSTESEVEKQFADLRDVHHADEFVSYLNSVIGNRFTDDYFVYSLPAELNSSSANSPAWYGYIAAVNVLGTPMLFSTAPLSQYFVLGANGDKNSVDKHHIFPKHYLEKIGYDNDRDRNQIANFTYLDYTTNIDISDEAPAEYVSRYREKLGEEGYRLACAQNALPENFEQLPYPEFLKQRRLLMAQIVKKAYNELDK